MNKKAIYTQRAPEPIGTYSQAIELGGFVFISGQIPVDPLSNQVCTATDDTAESVRLQAIQVFNNLQAICEQVGCNLNHILKLNLYLTDLKNFNIINEVMSAFFQEPYPARAAIEVSALPKNVNFEAEAILAKDA